MFTRTIKTVALAAAVMAASVGATMAGQYATIIQNASVYEHHKLQSDIINTVWQGDTVAVADKWKDWYYVITKGQDGWVRGKYLDFDYGPSYGGVGGSFCVNGQGAQFCLTTGF